VTTRAGSLAIAAAASAPPAVSMVVAAALCAPRLLGGDRATLQTSPPNTIPRSHAASRGCWPEVPDLSARRAQLPFSMGGLGLGSAEQQRRAVCWGSHVRRLLLDTDTPGTPPSTQLQTGWRATCARLASGRCGLRKSCCCHRQEMRRAMPSRPSRQAPVPRHAFSRTPATPLPVAPRRCPCGGGLDVYRDHRSACAQVGVLGRRASPL